MSDQPMTDHSIARRPVLQAAAGLVVASALPADAAPSPAADAAAASPAPGKPGEFDFLAGEWRISHRRLKSETGEWDEFTGEATCWNILGGVGSVEELRIPARNFAGMGLRLLDMDKRVWTDFWVNAKSGVLTTPGLSGYFHDGAGIFEADEMDGEQPIKVRGIWDRITPNSCRWHQTVSRDGGQTWAANWFMDWVRV